MAAKLTIEDMRKLAASHGGKFLSKTYLGAHTHHLWQCKKGHQWTATPSNIKHAGNWCPECAGRVKRDLAYLQKLASDKGGVLISDQYTRVMDKYTWQCADGHQWSARAYNIQVGVWCPYCASHLNERICRIYFESIFNRPFPTKRPNWLMNDWGNQMELDGFCKSLSLAFEYNGKQHYKRLPIFQKTQKAFERLQQSDRTKKRLCEENSVSLLVIPYTVPAEKLGDYIYQKCKSLGFAVPNDWDSTKVDLSKAYSPNKLQELRNLAASRGGRCLSKHYLGVTTKHEWECENGHRWKAIPDSVKHGTWCPTCAGQTAPTPEDMHRLAASRGGKCLSKSYQGYSIPLVWECSEGHVWKAPYTYIQQGAWCHECGGSKPKTLVDMHVLAAHRGGKCLSENYINSHTKLTWQCAEGHQWEAIPTNIQRGRWCPVCGDSTLTIERMQQLAAKHGGKCLSKEYVNNRTHLEWECAEGHRFKAQPRHIEIGRWCRICASNSRKKTIKDMQTLAATKRGKCLSSVYVNASTHLEWECAYGHRWMAKPNNIQQGKWCPECNRLRKKKNTK